MLLRLTLSDQGLWLEEFNMSGYLAIIIRSANTKLSVDVRRLPAAPGPSRLTDMSKPRDAYLLHGSLPIANVSCLPLHSTRAILLVFLSCRLMYVLAGTNSWLFTPVAAVYMSL